MDVESVQRLICKDTQEKLLKASETNKGCAAVLDMIWKVRMIYLGVNVPLAKRIEWCGYCLEFLFSWYSSFDDLKAKGTQKDHFITLEAFRDCIIALNYFINLVRLTRDTAPTTKVDFTRVGTNCCEDFFSLVGKWGSLGGQARGELFGDMLRTTKKMFHQILHDNQNAVAKNKLYAYEVTSLLPDEKKAGFNDSFRSQNFKWEDFSDSHISNLIETGRKEALEELKKLHVPLIVPLTGRYDKAHFKKCMREDELAALFAASQRGAMPTVEEDDDGDDLVEGVLFTREEAHDEDEVPKEVLNDLVDQLIEAEIIDKAIARINPEDIDSDYESDNGEPPDPGESAPTPVASTPKLVLKKLKSADGKEIINLLQAITLYNRWVQGGSKKHKERDAKIIEAALAASIKAAKEKGGDSSTTTAARVLMEGVGTDYFSIGSFVYVLFEDKEQLCKLFVGRIDGMTNYTHKKRMKWRLRVPLNEIPSTLCLRCSWLVPVVPLDNPNSYDKVTTPLYMYDAAKVLADNNQEFKASNIVEVIGNMERDPDTGLYRIPEDIVASAVKYRDIGVAERRERLESGGGPAPSKETKKRKAAVSEPLSEADMVTEDDIVNLGLRDVQVRPNNRSSDFYPARILSWTDPVTDEDDDAAVPARSFVIKYISDDKKTSVVTVQQMQRAHVSRVRKKSVRLNDQ